MGIADKVRDIIGHQLGVKKILVVDNAKIVDDLGADSLDVIELILSIEEAFMVEIPYEEVSKITVGDAIKWVETHAKKRPIEAKCSMCGASLIECSKSEGVIRIFDTWYKRK